MFSFFAVKEQSMSRCAGSRIVRGPSIEEGDFVIGMSYLFFKPQIGHIVIAMDSKGGRTILKRVIRVEGHRYWLEGDNTVISVDSRVFGWVDRLNIVARVVACIHKPRRGIIS